MLQIKKLTGGLLSSNSYVLFEDSNTDCWAIDIGDYSVIKDFTDSQKLKLQGAFLTHTHFDHIAGLNDFVNDNPYCRIFLSVFGKDALYSAKKIFHTIMQISLNLSVILVWSDF